MLSPLRNRFGIPGVISVVALVFAMLGGAYAASSNDNGKATASAKAKKGPRGPKGATGPAGPAGAQGPAGANGKDGSNGANGSNGATGANGTNGKNVVTGTLNPGQGGCIEGGAYVEVSGEAATKKSVCNGEAGPQGNTGNVGPEGSPWVAGEAPSGAELKGDWSVHTVAAAAEEILPIPISFSIPVDDEEPMLVDLVPPNGVDPLEAVFGEEVCTGSAENPTGIGGVAAGFPVVCAYAKSMTNLTPSEVFVSALLSSAGGPVLRSKATAAGLVDAYGSWAYIAT